MGLSSPVLMDVTHHTAPCINIARCPVVRVKQRMVELGEPTCEDGMSSRSCSRERGRRSSSCDKCSTAFSFDPLTDLWSIQIVELTLTTATS